jgi:GAF domain-containing protein
MLCTCFSTRTRSCTRAGSITVFAAVIEEAGQLLGADLTGLTRYDADGVTTVVGSWARTGPGVPPVGTRVDPSERSVSRLVFQTGRPARIDEYDDVTGETADIVHAGRHPLRRRRADHRR